MRTFRFLLLFLLMPALRLHAQEYVVTTAGENLVVSILSVQYDRVVFRQLEENDTTTYFLPKDKINAIGFGSDVMKRMRQPVFKTEQIIRDPARPVNFAYIYPVNAEPVVATIDSMTSEQVRFRMAFSSDTTVYFMRKEQIAQITFKALDTGTPGKPREQQDMSPGALKARAKKDAHKYYKGYRAASIVAFCTAFYPATPGGTVFSIVSTCVPPRDNSLGIPDPELKKERVYMQTYKTEAHKIKAGKVWKSFGFAMAIQTAVFLTLILASSAQS